MKASKYLLSKFLEIREVKIIENVHIKEDMCDVQLLLLEIKYTRFVGHIYSSAFFTRRKRQRILL